MTGLFIFDQVISKSENEEYYDPIFTNKVFDRYLKVVDNLIILVRTQEELAESLEKRRIPKIDTKRIKIVEISNMLSLQGILQRPRVYKTIEKFVKISDVIFVRMPSIVETMVVKVAKKYKKKYILELGGCPWDTFWNHNIKGKIIAPSRFLSTYLCIRKAPYVVYVTERWLQGRYPTNGQSINCSNVDIESVEDAALEKRLKKILSKKSDERIILGSIGDFHVKSKGHRFVIKALNELRKKGYNNYYYQIVGKGNRKELMRLIHKFELEDRVEFVSPMPHEEILSWLETIDIYIQPSRQEGLPRSVIEAMSKAVPVLGARTGGIPELIESEYIFENTRSEGDDIATLLTSLDINELSKMAIRNHNEAKKYLATVIETRRTKFFEMVVGQ
ncbi:glycosyltransferase family 4 protein [Mordavella massiliensis]|uniref:Glycosyltransferase family 4 protein n=2 Tax=Mordavella massiliensis TaxID=1871024 RepID=A0A938XCV3_9CLOT|nr:glycosyltransferase family 4 protein [Mordavella massiliensis]